MLPRSVQPYSFLLLTRRALRHALEAGDLILYYGRKLSFFARPEASVSVFEICQGEEAASLLAWHDPVTVQPKPYVKLYNLRIPAGNATLFHNLRLCRKRADGGFWYTLQQGS